MSKPRMRCRYGVWECFSYPGGERVFGYGETPEDAYWNWMSTQFRRKGFYKCLGIA